MTKEKWLQGCEFVREACNARFDWIENFYKDWRVVPEAIKENFLDTIEEAGVEADKTPSYVVDNFIINGEWGPASKWGWSKEEAQKQYEEGEITFICDNPDDENDPLVVL